MDTQVTVAIIGAAGVIVAAFIPFWLSQRNAVNAKHTFIPKQPNTDTTHNNMEQRLRQDSRIQRLLSNKNWQDPAEAAIAYHCHGTACPIKDWQKSSTWQQVSKIHAELTNN